MAEPTILQVVPRLDTGGSEQATVEIAEALDPRRRDSPRCHRRGPPGNRRDRRRAARSSRCPWRARIPFTMLANARRLERLIKERGVALVHARSRAPAWSALIAARRTGRPFVTTYHGAYGTSGPVQGRL